jgi:hypothetical protein
MMGRGGWVIQHQQIVGSAAYGIGRPIDATFLDTPIRMDDAKLRAAIAWSYDLLNAREQQIFRQLSVFDASFGLAEVQALFSPPDWPALQRDLNALVAQNLLSRSTDPHRPYTMLASIRAFAREEWQREERIVQIGPNSNYLVEV